MRFETRGGAFRYGAGAYTLRDVNFSLESGERLSILGANGAGKTTLIRCAAGLLAWSDGATYLDGADVRALPPREFRRRVGYVPQARPSAFVYTVMEMVLLGRLPCMGAFASPSAEDERKAREALELAGIPHLAERLCSRISGGVFAPCIMATTILRAVLLSIAVFPAHSFMPSRASTVLPIAISTGASGTALLLVKQLPAFFSG